MNDRNPEAPLRELPMTLRPFHREAAASFIRRLAAANHILARLLFNHVGESLPQMNLERGNNVMRLNRLAKERLAVLSGVDITALHHAIPDFQFPFPEIDPAARRPAREDIGQIYWLPRRRSITTACPSCCIKQGIHSHVAVWPPIIDNMVCRKHGYWRDETDDLTLHLGAVPEVVHAHWKLENFYRDLGPDHPRLEEARVIIHSWFHRGRHVELRDRWAYRIELIGMGKQPINNAVRTLVTMPELVTLTSCLRANFSHIDDYQSRRFRAQLCARLDVPTRNLSVFDPLYDWIESERDEQLLHRKPRPEPRRRHPRRTPK